MAVPWKVMVLCAVLLVFFGSSTTVRGDDPDFICGTGLLDGLTTLLVQAPGDNVVEARIVFVTFPELPDSEKALPNWAEDMQTDLTAYIRAMSRGAQSFDLSVLRRPAPDSALAWVADSTASYYQGSPQGWERLNNKIMHEIAATIPGAWDGVEQLFMVHYQCAWNACGVGGFASLGGAHPPVPGFPPGAGTTQHMFYGEPLVPFNSPRNRNGTKYIAGHEYGHRLGMGHPPPDLPSTNPNYVNMGRYDNMASQLLIHDGLVPYYPLHLSFEYVGPRWLPPNSVITMDVEGLRVPDIRGPDALVYEVKVPGSYQSFVFFNNQGTTSYDQKYLNTGLLIWHLFGYGWDLESAKGKFTDGEPNRESGEDSLEASNFHHGSADDFFDGSPSVFGCNTNPHTYLYNYEGPVPYLSPQDIPTSIAFENIQAANDSTGDMLVDVYVTPKQKVVFPNGGEHVCRGGAVTIQWAVRPSACATSVDVNLSADGGAGYVLLAEGEANDGEYMWIP